MKKITSTLFLLYSFITFSQQINSEKINWLKKNIHPIKNIDNSKDQGLNWFYQTVKNINIIGLGEVSHGSHENFIIKNKIVQFLAKRDSSFNVYALESNMAKGSLINNFIHNNTNSSPKEVLQNVHGIYQSQEFIDLLNWMKDYNKIDFYGFDIQYFQQSIIEIKKELKDKTSLNLISEINRILTSTFKKRLASKDFISLSKKDRGLFFKNIKLLKNKLEKLETSDKQKEWLNQNLKLLTQFIDYKNRYTRDKAMAENILWIKKQHPKSKILVSAHNLHLRKDKFTQGHFLNKQFKGNYISIGFLLYEGSIAAKITKYDNKKRKILLDKTPTNSYEHILNQLNEPLFLIDLRTIKNENSNYSKWFLKKRKHREVGSTIYTNSFNKYNITKIFDIIIFIKHSTPSFFFHK